MYFKNIILIAQGYNIYYLLNKIKNIEKKKIIPYVRSSW